MNGPAEVYEGMDGKGFAVALGGFLGHLWPDRKHAEEDVKRLNAEIKRLIEEE
jgi:hypothetical protein